MWSDIDVVVVAEGVLGVLSVDDDYDWQYYYIVEYPYYCYY